MEWATRPAILWRAITSSYSVVLRDNQNRDRIPASGTTTARRAETEKGLEQVQHVAEMPEGDPYRPGLRARNESVVSARPEAIASWPGLRA